MSVSMGGLVLSGVARLWRRYVVMAVVLVVSAGAVSLGACLGSYAGGEAQANVDDRGALTRITVYDTGAPLTRDVLARITATADVESVAPVATAQVALEMSRSSLTLLSYDENAAPPLVSGRAPAAAGEIVLPASADGFNLQRTMDTEVPITFTEGISESSGTTAEVPMRVVGIADPSYQVDAPIAAYALNDDVVELASRRYGLTPEEYLDQVGYQRLLVTAASTEAVQGVTEQLQSQGLQAVSALQELDAVPGVITLIRATTAVLGVVLLIVSGVAVVGTAHAIGSRRAQDVAVMRAYGWSPSRAQLLITAESGIVATASILVGTAAGVLAATTFGSAVRDDATGGALGDMSVPIGPLVLGTVLAALLVVVSATAATARSARVPVVDVLQGLA